MTPESQRLALARWGGWTFYKSGSTEGWWPPGSKRLYEFLEGRLPDFLHDLNAVAQLEEKLAGMEDEPWRQYVVFLGGICYEPLPPHLRTAWHDSEEFQDWLCFRATAAQRCEALLRTLGLWEE